MRSTGSILPPHLRGDLLLAIDLQSGPKEPGDRCFFNSEALPKIVRFWTKLSEKE